VANDDESVGRPTAITPEVLRGLRALACALTAPQAEHPDVRTACEWLQAVGLEGSTLFDRRAAREIIQKEASYVLRKDPFISDPRVDYAGIAQTIAERAARRMALGRRPLDRDRLMQVAKETYDEHVRHQWLNVDRILSAVVKRVIDEIEGKIDGEMESWWDEHTVTQLVVTHLNAHGARVLFVWPERGILMATETPKQAQHQLTYAREHFPEEAFEIREARFWRAADGRPGHPVHMLIDDAPHQAGCPPAEHAVTAPVVLSASRVREVMAKVIEGAIQETLFIDDLKDSMRDALVDVVADRAARQLAGCQMATDKHDNVAETVGHLPGPGQLFLQAVDQHLFAITLVKGDGAQRHSDPPCYRVECRICGLLVHEATTSLQEQISRHLHDTRRLIELITQAGGSSHALRTAVCEVNRAWNDEGDLPWQQPGEAALPTIKQAIRSPTTHGISSLEGAALRWLISRAP
jgi:hypothetical protein